MKIYNLGSLNIDYVYSVPHFVRPGETLDSDKREVFPGGKGLNQSVALSKAGANVIHGGFVGDDGELLLETLKNAGVDTGRIAKASTASGHTIIQVDATGQNCIILFGGANRCFTPEYIEDVLGDAEEGDILLLQNEVNALTEIFRIAHQKKMQIAFNPSPYDKSILDLPLQYVSYWLCNEIEGEELTGERDPEKIIENLSARYPDSSIVLTLGKNGCKYKSKDTSCYQPIFKVSAVDTTAAGDTFTGYFLSSLTKGIVPEEALKIASAASAIAVSRQGAASSIPTPEEVSAFLAEHA